MSAPRLGHLPESPSQRDIGDFEDLLRQAASIHRTQETKRSPKKKLLSASAITERVLGPVSKPSSNRR
jgi:hypothetical protein